jgi:hypothetical protein
MAAMFAVPITLTYRDTTTATRTLIWAELPTYPSPTPTDGTYDRWIYKMYMTTDSVIDPLDANGNPTGDDVLATNYVQQGFADNQGKVNLGPTGGFTINSPALNAYDQGASETLIYHSIGQKIYLRVFNSSSLATATKSFTWAAPVTVLSATATINITPTPGWGTWVTHAVLVTKPNPAVLVYPTSGDTGLAYSGQTLAWASGDAKNAPTGYKVYFGTAATPVTLVQNSADLSYDTDALTPDTWYYWQVVPYNTAGDALDCPVWSFKTRAEMSPGLATNPVPADGAMVTTLSYPYNQEISWNAPTSKIGFLSGYKVYVGTSTTPTDIVNGTTTIMTSHVFEVPGPGTYYWKIVPYYIDPGTKSVKEGRALPARAINVNNVKGDAVGAVVWSFVSDLEIVTPDPDIPAGDSAPVAGGIAGGGAEVTTTIDLYNGPAVDPDDPVFLYLHNLANVPNPIFVSYSGVGIGRITFEVGPGTWWGLAYYGGAWHMAETPSNPPLIVTSGNTGQLIFHYVDFGAKGDVIFVIAEGDDPLPVELASFTATLTSQYFVNLKWVTESENQVLGFNVYRSESNSITASSKINAVIIPATNTSQQTTYTHTDTEELEMNHTYYYWLENVDMNGTTQFHGPISATITGQTPPVLPEITMLSNAYPNPFKVGKATNINVTLKAGETGTVTIYNILGQVVKTYKVNQGQHKLEWNAKGCASGIYFYKLSTPTVNATKKLVIIN